MASLHTYLVISLLTFISCNAYYPISSGIETCCGDPVNAFIMREFSGACACMTLQQKWKRYVDWVQLEGGYINPWIELSYVDRYEDIDSNSKSKNNKMQHVHFQMHSHERGVFVNIQEKYRRKIHSKALLMQIPFSISFSQFVISKYIRNSETISKIDSPAIKDILFPTADHFMPDGFPDWDEFHVMTKHTYNIDSIRGWLALGLAWLRENTYELLPWIELLPLPDYLPITWHGFVRDEFLLTGTRALKVVQQLEREYATAKPYMKILALKDCHVKQVFAWITSRSFGMSLDKVNGAKRSPVIPCGIDFFNHNIFAESHLYYDTYFGANRFMYNGNMQNQQIVENLVLTHKPNGMVREIDFASNFLWVNTDIINQSQIFVNYGKYHTSASRLALFGFIDPIHPYDHYSVHLDLLRHDSNYYLKRKYFQTVWNSTYTQENKTKHYSKEICSQSKIDSSTWFTLGKTLTNYQSANKKKTNQRDEQRVYAPPLTMEFYGQKTIRVQANFLRFLRLAYLPQEYFDSFTISSILNDFEYDYVQNRIDPIILFELNNICSNLLNEYPNSLLEDELQLQQIESERRHILLELQLNMNKNMSETKRLSDIISSLDRHSLVLQYRVREKEFLDKCTRLQFQPTQEYLNSIQKKRKNKMRKTKKRNIIASSDGLEQWLRATFDISNPSNPRRKKHPIANITQFNDSTANNISNSNHISNLSQYETNEANELDINYVELLKQIEDIFMDTLGTFDGDINAQLFNVELDETVLYQNQNDNSDELRNESNENENEIAAVVSKKNLVIGKPKQAKQQMAQTIGWNSPNAGIGNNDLHSANSQQQSVTFMNMNTNMNMDLTSLFSANMQINNGRITITANNNNNNNNLNNLLTQFGINIASGNNNNNDVNINNAALDIVNNNEEDIPETVPFSQIMNSATVSVFSMDANGNLINVGNTLNANNVNLAQLFANRKKKNKPKPNP